MNIIESIIIITKLSSALEMIGHISTIRLISYTVGTARKRGWRCNIGLRLRRSIGNVYNIIENISPIHFWHHYLCSRVTITCERSAFVAPAPPLSAVARLFARRVVVRRFAHVCAVAHWVRVRGELDFGGFSNVMRSAYPHGMRTCCRREPMHALPRRHTEICGVNSQWLLGLQCWIIGSESDAVAFAAFCKNRPLRRMLCPWCWLIRDALDRWNWELFHDATDLNLQFDTTLHTKSYLLTPGVNKATIYVLDSPPATLRNVDKMKTLN